MSTRKEIQDLRKHLQFRVVDGTFEHVEFNVSKHYRAMLVYRLGDDTGYLTKELLWGLDENTSS